MARECERCQYENTDEARFCLQCGAMLETTSEPDADPLIGRVLLHRYRVVSELGEGGMGKVYLAEQKMGTALRKVAIKTLHPELSGDPQLVARFHRECETVIELHHPNTVKFYDFGDLEDKTLFIVMEYIEGGDLSKRLQEVGSLSPALADKLLIQICGSLHEAHERGVVHRDLKPENVLLTTRGGQSNFVKVLDFGIAKRSEAEDESTAKLTKQGMVLGTPPYMSPEQFSGQTLDLRSDIYSLGVMTYEMVTGHLPFEARTPWEWATKHLTVQPTPIETYPAGAALPQNKRNAIMRALSKNRDERQANALVFMHEFTGLGDAQSAWTMATSSGVGSQPGTHPGSNPGSHPGSHPGSQPGSHPGSQPGSQPGFGSSPGSSPGTYAPTGSQPGAPLPSPGPMGTPVPSQHGYQTPTPAPTEFQSGMLPAQSKGGSGKWVLLSLVAFVLLGAVAGGAWIMTKPTEVATTDPANTGPVTTGPVGTTPNNGAPVPNPNMQVGTPIASMMGAVGTPMVEPMVETPMLETPMVEPMVETPMIETTMMDPPRMTTMTMRQTSMANAAARQRAAAALANAERQINSGNIPSAGAALRSAQEVLGRRDRNVVRVRNALSAKGALLVGNAVMAGNCAGAQRLLSALRRVGADRRARSQLGDACD